MRLLARLRRFPLPLITGLAVTGMALPARAETLPAHPLLILNLTDTVTVVAGPPKTVTFDVTNVGTADAVNAVIRFGPSPRSIGFAPPAGCSATECRLDRLGAGERHAYPFTLTPDPSAPAVTASLTVRAAVGGVDMGAGEVRVVRTTQAGVDLEIDDLKDLKLGRGESATLPVSIRNSGRATSGTIGRAGPATHWP